MSSGSRLLVSSVLAAMVSTLTVGVAGVSFAAQGDGSVNVTISTPEGVPANVVVEGSEPVSDNADAHASNVTARASKPPSGTSASSTLSLPSGAYRVRLPDVQYDGVRYVGTGSRPEVVVPTGGAVTLQVTYKADGGARELHLTSSAAETPQFAWTGPLGASYRMLRAEGDTPPERVTDGTQIAVSGTTARDPDAEQGKVYSYSLFSRTSAGWFGPLTVTTSVAPSDSSRATYVKAASTWLAKASEVVSTAASDGGLSVVFHQDTPVPLLGSAIVLPIMDDLDGGFLGTVTALSADGHTVTLAPAGLGDAFDYYKIDIEEFSGPAVGEAPAVAKVAATTTTKASSAATEGATSAGDEKSSAADGKPSDPSEWKAYRAAKSKVWKPLESSPAQSTSSAASPEFLAAPASAKSLAAPASPEFLAAPASAKSLAAPASALQTCSKAEVPAVDFVDFTASLTPQGHFSTEVQKWGPFPKSASVDLGVSITATGAASAKVSGVYKCKLPLPSLFRTITTSPVPISLLLEPVAEVSVGAAATFSNIGVQATAGFNAHASISVTSGISAGGEPVVTAGPLVPKLESGSAEVGTRLGGALTLGPGVGTKTVGAIAGVRGELYLLEAKATVYPPVGQPGCLNLKAGASMYLLLTARAWLGKWSTTADFPLFNQFFDYPGSPWSYPSGCTAPPEPTATPEPPDTPDDVIGDGVTQEDDSSVGVPGQQGYVEGLIPGEKTWVLSTGLIADAIGSPGSFASTELGTEGDADLSAMSGHQTYDAASYQVTVVPSGSTLHVKYLFASEEYPEWVGSRYNDVMAVYVDGKNCAFVPGTQTPVAINTINAYSNSAYYVDNRTGVGGYNTSYDGLTLPLTCSVPVTPGRQVTVKIAVADGSDAVYDSAVALVQSGIWSD